MADNKKARGKTDRSKVSKSEGYEVAYFARKHGMTAAQTRNLIDKVGNDRNRLDKVAGTLRDFKKSGYKPAGVTTDGVVIVDKGERSTHFTSKEIRQDLRQKQYK